MMNNSADPADQNLRSNAMTKLESQTTPTRNSDASAPATPAAPPAPLEHSNRRLVSAVSCSALESLDTFPAKPSQSLAASRVGLARFGNAVPMLEKKHSSGDLQSRLKTRKVLGVGVTNSGEVHRSKISQVLGHNEHLYRTYPRGLETWLLVVSIGLAVQGGLMVLSPGVSADLALLPVNESVTSGDLSLVARGYGFSLLGVGYLLHIQSGLSDKTPIVGCLRVTSLMEASMIFLHVISTMQTGVWSWYTVLLAAVRISSSIISIIYLCLVGGFAAGRWCMSPMSDLDSRQKSS